MTKQVLSQSFQNLPLSKILNLKLKVLFFLLIPVSLFAQLDSVVFENNNFLVGEVKEMNRGVLTFETDYSDSDFKIEWDKVKAIYTYRYYIITLETGENIFGNITTDSLGIVTVSGVKKKFRAYTDPILINLEMEDVVYIKSIDKSFWKKLDASVELGYSFTKASNLNQLNGRLSLGYLSDKWSLKSSVSALSSIQDSVDPTQRLDGQTEFNYIIKRNFYALTSSNFLSNTEQQLDLRSSQKLGVGNYFFRNNQWYLSMNIGIAGTNEVFATEATNRESLEGFLGLDFNIFDAGDVSFNLVGTAYPSISTEGRFRFDLKSDLKFDLPLDFYIKVGLSMNYDNQPAVGGNDIDYIVQTNFGWEL